MLAVTNTISEELHTAGHTLIPSFLLPDQISALLHALSKLPPTLTRQRSSATYAIRHVAHYVPEVAALAQSPLIHDLLHPLLDGQPILVRSLLFDKNPSANWRVPWHQDTTIAVRHRHELRGFGPWSIKAGIPHVQPPRGILERMLTLRIHLDPCPIDNGPLRVLSGSHRAGILDSAGIQQCRAQIPATTCTAGVGDALLIRPLLLHASSPATCQPPTHRRILHLEFSADLLPHPLEWAD